jgi:ketosteroid isomerase-like protein
MTSVDSEIRAHLEDQLEAIETKDLERLMGRYSDDVVYFDVVPPLRFVGSAALRERFTTWFDSFDGPIRMDVRDLTISIGGDIAVVHWLSRASGTLRNGRQVGSWVRATSCCRREGHGWLTTHEHISLPVDVASGTPVVDLEP